MASDILHLVHVSSKISLNLEDKDRVKIACLYTNNQPLFDKNNQGKECENTDWQLLKHNEKLYEYH